MKKVLWISPYVPYDNAAHAGGKTHNYYIKYLHRSGLFDIHLVTLAQGSDLPKLDLDAYGISNAFAVLDGGVAKNVCRMLFNMNSMLNNRHPLCQIMPSYHYVQLKKMIMQYAQKNTPDIVIMQWTRAAFLLPVVKKLFPASVTVIIEEDVSFLGYERRYLLEKNKRKKAYLKVLYDNLKRRELALLNACDLVVVNNEKDKALLLENALPTEIYVCPPYYEKYDSLKREEIRPEMIFYGAMHRKENHQCAMWLVEQVMPKLCDTDIYLTIIGSHPKEELKRRQSEKIHVKGYVEDVSTYFSHCLCMAAPLQMGAGIKVKILEGLSAGIPVLTTDVGIEGIPARDGLEYFHCETVEEYVKIIRSLYQSEEEQRRIGSGAREFMKNTYNIDKRLDDFIERLQEG